ncbi:UNVERIFIED_CONTAM: hypothetical protein GTU68_019583 [Idotea baltica]|nr:hypothetical protein [Idotea baltica]
MHWKIDSSLKIVVLGLGYVGLPTAIAFSKKYKTKYKTIGVDTNNKRIEELKKGVDRKGGFSKGEILENLNLVFETQISFAQERTVFIVTVPTPVTAKKEPDLSFLTEVSKEIAFVLKMGDLVIYESTTFPGCTEEVCIPILELHSKLKLNIDFGVGYSPERYSPGETKRVESIIRVTSGSSKGVAEMVDKLYGSIMEVGTYLAPSIKVAEAAKLAENCQRDLNISFVNELALIFDRMNISTSEVLKAAKTKWNFLDFKPGLVGGHCISVDPYYMIHKARALDYDPKVIGAGRLVNEEMGRFIAHKCMKLMTRKGIALNETKVLILGFAYKANCSDFRNTKVIDLYKELLGFGVQASVYDPLVDNTEVSKESGLELEEKLNLEDYEVVIVAVNHDCFVTLNLEGIPLVINDLFN